MTERIRWIATILAAATLAGAAGCGGSGLDLTPVSGTVKLDGAPLADATVTFLPLDKQRGQTDLAPAIGTTDTQGRFILWTAGETGAAPGRHAVTITQNLGLAPDESLPDDRSEWKAPESPIPARYSNTSSPELTFTVPPEGTDAANFELEGAAKQ
jgi:hypothetical protein